MEGTLPFEYGVLYKQVNGPMSMGDLQADQGTYLNSLTYNPDFAAYASYPLIQESFHFLPIAFEQKRQMVIGEVRAREELTRNISQPSSDQFGIRFVKDSAKETQLRPYRMEIPVEEFIKNFEKVL